MQSSTWIMHISNAVNQIHELDPPTCVLLFVQEFYSFHAFFCSLLIMSILSHPLCHYIYKDNFISFTISPPLSSITIKGMPLLIQWVVLGVDDWFLNLQKNFMDITVCWNDTTCNYYMWKHEDHLEKPHVCHL
jgi:hypothetical protein